MQALSFDWETIPENFSLLNETALSEYERRLLPLGSKSKPYYHEGYGLLMHNDGLFAEAAPRRPSVSPDQLLAHRDNVLTAYAEMLGLRMTAVNFLDLRNVRHLNESVVPKLMAEINTFGCSPDYLHGKRRITPKSLAKSPFRESGMHLHLNLAPQFCDRRSPADMERNTVPTNAVVCAQIAEEFYEATAFLHEGFDKSLRLWYRSPRLYRPKPYGIEYRSFGAAIGADLDKFSLLIDIAFAFMRDHFNTHYTRRYV